jgi:hypothetical protein
MMNKIRSVTGVLLICTITLSHAQVADATIKGSPYLNETFEEGVIILANNNFKVPARYNVYKDEMEYKQNGRALILDPAASVKKIQLHDATFVVQKYMADGKSKLGYFTLLDSGKVMLYAKKAVSYLPAKKGAALDGSDRPAEYKKVPDTFYYKIGDNGLVEVKNIKSMIGDFPDKQEELAAFAKKEKISPRKEDEMVQFVKYYNSLQ